MLNNQPVMMLIFYWTFTEVLWNFGTQNSSCLISSSTWYSVSDSGDDSVTSDLIQWRICV